jgi:predicted O-methyltransferase YrrM
MIDRTEPWLTEDANKILTELVNKGKNLSVFEFGSGASTIWFSKQENVNVVISVEHDMDWWNQVGLIRNKDKAIIHLENQPYNHLIDRYGLFDIILVDGRNRVKCIESALPHLKESGVLILDNSEREYYQKGIDLMAGFQRIDTFQPNPDKYGFTYPGWKTSFFFNNKTIPL